MSHTFTEQEIVLGDERIAVWQLGEAEAKGLPIVLAPGFGRSMEQLTGMAMCFAECGFVTYRYDHLHHIGLSSGKMEDFTMGAAHRTMGAVIDWVSARHDGIPVGLFTNSLASRVAYRLAAHHAALSYLLTAVGVVNLRATLAAVFGSDYWHEGVERPEYVEFERKKVRGDRFYADSLEGSWMDTQGTVSDVRAFKGTLIAFLAEKDDWVSPSEASAVIGQSFGEAYRHIIELQGSSHELGRNPRNAERFMLRAVELAMKHACPDSPRKPTLPNFENYTNQALLERRIQRAAL